MKWKITIKKTYFDYLLILSLFMNVIASCLPPRDYIEWIIFNVCFLLYMIYMVYRGDES